MCVRVKKKLCSKAKSHHPSRFGLSKVICAVARCPFCCECRNAFKRSSLLSVSTATTTCPSLLLLPPQFCTAISGHHYLTIRPRIVLCSIQFVGRVPAGRGRTIMKRRRTRDGAESDIKSSSFSPVSVRDGNVSHPGQEDP